MRLVYYYYFRGEATITISKKEDEASSGFFWLLLRFFHLRSPLMRRASCMSLGMMVTRLAWMAHRLVSSNSPVR